MKRLAALLSLLALSASAWACPAGAVLAKQYNISAFGIPNTIPVTKAPTANLDEFVEVAFPDRGEVRDGFYHTAFINPATRQAWIHETGGFLGVNAWYGPFDIKGLSLTGCQTRKQLKQQDPSPGLRLPSL